MSRMFWTADKAYCLQHAARCFEPGRHRRDRAA